MEPREPFPADAGDSSAHASVSVSPPTSTGWDTVEESALRRPWREEMARWLLSLTPGRTQEEYAKAVRYFFETPGAPQELDTVVPDLLLAYRGVLASRAERTGERRVRTAAVTRFARLWGASGARGAIEGEAPPGASAPPIAPRPLAPATVNLRLTALRQFLRFAALRQALPALTVEQIHAALKRLPIERRRPYQILAEEEWNAFLITARSPLARESDAPVTADTASAAHSATPWGHTRAERTRAFVSSQPADGEASATSHGSSTPSRASDGRTGALTARRDYALVALALATGLRAIELSLLDVGDVSHERRRGQDEWWLTLPDVKTKGQRGGRALPLAADLVATLRDYLQSTGRSLDSLADRTAPLFLALRRGPVGERLEDNQHYARLRPEQIRGVINRVESQWLARQREGSTDSRPIEEGRRISPHALRHSAAIALLKGSEETGRPPASVEHVRGWLGHFDIRTTQRYLDHLNSREERRRFVIQPLNASPPSESGEQAKLSGATNERNSSDE